jgi:hypothetical protein
MLDCDQNSTAQLLTLSATMDSRFRITGLDGGRSTQGDDEMSVTTSSNIFLPQRKRDLLSILDQAIRVSDEVSRLLNPGHVEQPED